MVALPCLAPILQLCSSFNSKESGSLLIANTTGGWA